jgi:threonine synthase
LVSPVRPSTIAKSLAIGNPADGLFALDVARNSGGSVTGVSEQEIVDGIQLLAETTGIFTETAGGVTTATLARLAREGVLAKDSSIVVYITGDGLKTLDAVSSLVHRSTIAPTVASFEQVVEGAPVAA